MARAAVFWRLYQLNFLFGRMVVLEVLMVRNGNCIFKPRDILVAKPVCPNPKLAQGGEKHVLGVVGQGRRGAGGRPGAWSAIEAPQILIVGLLLPSGSVPCRRCLKLSQVSVTWGCVRKFDVAH